MKCYRCKGERIVWKEDKYGRAVANSCPICNKNGIPIRKETRDLKNGHHRDILDQRNMARGKQKY